MIKLKEVVIGKMVLRFEKENMESLIEKIKKDKFNDKRMFNFLNSECIYFYRNESSFETSLWDKRNFNCLDGFINSVTASIKEREKLIRIRGPTFTDNFLKSDFSRNKKHFFIGKSLNDVLKIADNYGLDRNKVFAYNPPYVEGNHFPEYEINKMVNTINTINPDYLWVGVGSPKQNILSMRLINRIETKYIFNVGAALDFIIGNKKEAPKLFRNLGLEWLYRLITDFKHSKKKVWRSVIGSIYGLNEIEVQNQGVGRIGYYVADINPEKNSSLGVQRFAMRVLEGLYERGHNLTLFCNPDNYYLFKKFEDKFKVVQMKKVSNNRIINRLVFDQYLINKYAKKEGIGTLIFPKGILPFYKVGGINYFSVIHDLIPKHYVFDKGFGVKTRLKYIPSTYLLTKSAKKSDKIFTVSEFSMKEIAKHTSEYKIKVVPEGSDLEKSNEYPPYLQVSPYFYIVGNRNPHKNLQKAIDLFREYNRRNNTYYKAVITTKPPEECDDDLLFLDNVSDSQLVRIYKNAELSLFLPSLEGFGLPLIESYSQGTPVVFNKETSLEEVGEELEGGCDVNDKESVFRAIDRVLNMSEEDIERDKKYLESKYNWKDCVDMIEEELK